MNEASGRDRGSATLIKASVLSRSLRRLPGLEGILIHTGKHYEENMSSIFFDQLEMPCSRLQPRPVMPPDGVSPFVLQSNTIFEQPFWLDLVAPGRWRAVEVNVGG